ncbi:two-component system, OmpR family, response regulator YxdJ [Gracilibacillus orientalis]|uniref:Two-component system, OmpR family, response regulator YxdJ n=1 Tax=Gracilibacillus orientalis TaxID=334253 RepID=A0A1I4QXX8_9BACI|nr:response regulator transcription factor [Gracilibacillus orientalis]SFM44898.1 two-component system, OmpR family, response regulator YxdJ [Gracilibacillus orientalis]
MRRIYIVEDDPKIRDILTDYLQKYDYDIASVNDFDQIQEEFQDYQPHLVLLDINLPRFDGFYWCRKIRAVSNCPIIFISARDSGMDQVMAIENGADDYITKPFQLEVVLAKIKSLMRRVYGEYRTDKNSQVIDVSGLQLDNSTFTLSFQDKQCLLTKKECLLAKAFLTQVEKIVSREYLLERLWDDQDFVDDNTLSVNITRVRKKLADLGIEGALKTIRGAGYKLEKVWERSS